MGELPLQCFFPLTKLVCCYPYVPPEDVIPAINALYHPDLYSEFFHSSDSEDNRFHILPVTSSSARWQEAIQTVHIWLPMKIP